MYLYGYVVDATNLSLSHKGYSRAQPTPLWPNSHIYTMSVGVQLCQIDDWRHRHNYSDNVAITKNRIDSKDISSCARLNRVQVITDDWNDKKL